MADDPLNVQHKIRLEYEEQIKSSLLPHLAALQNQLGQITRSFQKHSKGIGSIGSATKGTTKINQAFGKSSARAAAQMSGMSKMAFGAGKALGYVGIVAIGTAKAFGLMYGAIKKIADSQAIFAEFAAQTGKGSEAVFALKSAYVDLSKVTDLAAISVRGLTTAMADFASTGFPQQLMASSDAAMAAVGKLEDTLIRAVGAENARKMTSAVFHGALKDNVPVLNSLIDSLQRAGTEGRSMEQDIGNIARQFAAFDEVNFRGIMGAMQTIQDQAQGTADGGVAAFTKWEQLTSKLGALFTQLKQNLIDAFGADLASLLDTASKKMSDWIGDIGTWLETIKGWYVGVKVIVHNFVEVWKKAWYGIKGIGEMTFAGLTIIASKFLSWLPGKWGEAGDAMKKWAIDVGKAGEKAFGYSMDFQYVDEEIAKSRARQTKATKENLSPLAALLAKQTEIRDQLTKTILPGVTSWTAALKNTASVMQSLGDLTDLVGANYQVMGQNIGDFAREMGQAQLEVAHELLDASSSEKLLETLKLIRNINQEIDMEGPSVARTQKLAEAMKQQSDILAGQVEAYKTLKMYIQNYTKDIDASLRLTEKSRQLSEAQLKVTQAVYGTPALAVQAQLAIVKTMEKEKNLLRERLAREQEAIANMSKADIAAGGLQFAQEALLKTQTEITNKTAAQLEIVKQLRDGYLSAVKAQALGAGRFSKILITQEQNIMRGLKNRVVKANYLMGLYGKASGAGKAQAMRFSDSRLGLETMSGQEVTPEMARREQEARMAGAGAGQSAVGREANDIVMGIVSSADQNTINVIESQTEQTIEIVGAIDRLASSSVGTAYAAGGKGRPGETRIGEAMRRVGKGVKVNDFDVGGYLEHAKARGSSSASQNAMLRFQSGGRPGPITIDDDFSGTGKAGKVEVFKVAAANRFNIKALEYYDRILEAILACCDKNKNKELALAMDEVMGPKEAITDPCVICCECPGAGKGGTGPIVPIVAGGAAAGGGMSTGTGIALGGAGIGAGLAVGGLGVGAGLAIGGGGLGGLGGLAAGGMGLAGAAAVGVGMMSIWAAPWVIGGAIAIHAAEKTNKQLQEQEEIRNTQFQKSAEQLTNLALKYGHEGDALRAERTNIEKELTSIVAGATETSFWGTERLTGEFTDTQNKQLEYYRKKRRAVNAKIKAHDEQQYGVQLPEGVAGPPISTAMLGPLAPQADPNARFKYQVPMDTVPLPEGVAGPPELMQGPPEIDFSHITQKLVDSIFGIRKLEGYPAFAGPPEPMMGPTVRAGSGGKRGQGFHSGPGGGAGTMTMRMMAAAKILMEIAGAADELGEEQNNLTEYANNRSQTNMPPN